MERPHFDIVQWQQGFECGIEKLDKHRKRLVKIFNMMVERYNARTCKDNIAEPFFKLAFSTESYFYDLEITLRQLNYSKLAELKKSHKAIRERIVQFKEDFTAKKESVCLDMITFMGEWLETTIIHVDEPMVSFLKEKGLV